jgi:hypothetical protein
MTDGSKQVVFQLADLRSLDLSDATIVHLSSTCFSDHLLSDMAMKLSAVLPDGAKVVSQRELRALVPVSMQGPNGRAVKSSVAKDGATMLATVFQESHQAGGPSKTAFVNRLALTSVLELETSWVKSMDVFVYEAQPESHRSSRHDLFSWDGVYDAVEVAKIEKRKPSMESSGRVPFFEKVSGTVFGSCSSEHKCGDDASFTDGTFCKLAWGAKGKEDEFSWAGRELQEMSENTAS